MHTELKTCIEFINLLNTYSKLRQGVRVCDPDDMQKKFHKIKEFLPDSWDENGVYIPKPRVSKVYCLF